MWLGFEADCSAQAFYKLFGVVEAYPATGTFC